MDIKEMFTKNPSLPIGMVALLFMFSGYILLVTKPTEGTSHRQIMGVGVILLGGILLTSATLMKGNKNIIDAMACASQKQAATT
jgi:drug/metabolite transporter (DMT)-like permease